MALAGPAPTPTRYNSNSLAHLAKHRFQIELPVELVLCLEDQAANSGVTLQQYVNQAANDALQAWLHG